MSRQRGECVLNFISPYADIILILLALIIGYCNHMIRHMLEILQCTIVLRLRLSDRAAIVIIYSGLGPNDVFGKSLF